MQPSRPLQNREEAGFQGATSVRIAIARISQVARSGRSRVPRGHICANSDSTHISGCKIGKKQGSKGRQPFVRVRTQTTDYDSDLFGRFIQEEDQIVECHDIDGEDCYILKVRTTSTQSLQKLLTTIRNFPGITRTVTTIALETLKEKGTVRPAVNKTKPENG